MSRHIIKKEDFETPYIIYHELAGSYGKVSCKTLKARINITNEDISYEVLDQHIKVYETSLLDSAIYFYNDLP
jgi:hypothetical protein